MSTHEQRMGRSDALRDERGKTRSGATPPSSAGGQGFDALAAGPRIQAATARHPAREGFPCPPRVAGDDPLGFDAVWADGEPAPHVEQPIDEDMVLAFADRWTSWDRWACSLIVTLIVGIIVGHQLHALQALGWFR